MFKARCFYIGPTEQTIWKPSQLFSVRIQRQILITFFIELFDCFTCGEFIFGAMFLTAPLFSKSNLLGSLINKFRPANVAPLSLTSPAQTKTIEEQIGLPPRPKRPLTPYFRFMQDLRQKYAAENPKLTHRDVVREIAKKWYVVDPDLKKRLEEEYKREQEKYIEIRTKYDSKVSDDQRDQIRELKQTLHDLKEKREVRKRIRELGRPKKPASAFIRFVIQERTTTPQLPKQTYREWHEKCTAKWTRLSELEKEPFILETRKHIVQYRKDIDEWEERMIKLGHTDVVRQGNLIDTPAPKKKTK